MNEKIINLVEIIEFFPINYEPEKQILEGTIRVRLPDLGLNILGIHISKRKNFWYFCMPGRKAICHKTGKQIRYPFIVFEDQEKQRALIAVIRERGRQFVEARLADTSNPIACAPKPQQALKQAERPKKEKPAAIKQSAPAKESAKEMPKPIKSLAAKQWVDPPKKPAGARNSSKFARR